MKFSTLLYPSSLQVALGAAAISSSPNDAALVYSDQEITLSSDGTTPGTFVIDFGQSYEGHPTFEVVSASGDTSVFEVSYAESKAALSLYQSDGPLVLAAAMDSYRVNRYNISSSPLVNQNRLIQGAFRYQKLNLSTAGQLVLRNVGVRQTVHTTPLTELPGAFECSDEDLTRIWHTGARTVQLTEIPANTIPDFWVVTEEGALVESLAPQGLTAAGAGQLLGFNMSVDVKASTGAFIVSVLIDTLSVGVNINFDLNAGTVGASFESASLVEQPLNVTVSPGEWLTVGAVVNMADISISLNGATVLTFSQDKRIFGSLGMGTPMGHTAVFRNLVAKTLTGDAIYSSTLTDPSFLNDFTMGTNPADTIVDGSRRDRIAYNGDLDIALAATFASTYGVSFAQGSLDLLGSAQMLPGFFLPTAKIQQGPFPGLIPANITGLIGYSFNLVTAMAQTYMALGDVAFAQKWTPAIVRMLDWADSQLVDGLFTLTDPTFVGDWNYYDPPQLGATTKFNAVYAYALQQALPLLAAAGTDTSVYTSRLDSLRTAMHARLFDASLGAYKLSTEIADGFAQDAQAIAILAGVPQVNNQSAADILNTMEHELLLPAGPLAFSNSTVAAGFAQKISPYASSYHLRAAFEAGDADGAMKLLKTLWAPMADPGNVNYTNSFWETLNPDGTPGLGLPTSLCHGWASGPTAELSRYVLGIQVTAAGFNEYVVKPVTLGLGYARGRQQTERGVVSVDWSFGVDGLLKMTVDGPAGGLVYLPSPLATGVEGTTLTVNGKVVGVDEFPVSVEGETVIVQTRR